MVNVKVENTRGGYILVYYEDETKGDAQQYLPIGETVQVPEGVELKYLAKALDWHPKDGDKWYRGIILDVEGSGAAPVKSSRYELDQRESGVFPAVEGLIIKGDFKALEKTKNYDDSDEPEEPEEPDDESWDIGFYAEDDQLDTFNASVAVSFPDLSTLNKSVDIFFRFSLISSYSTPSITTLNSSFQG